MSKDIITYEDWKAEGTRRFGEDLMAWKFVCPSCGHVASVRDWKAAGAPESAVGFSCVGRWLDGPVKQIFERPGPCNYAGGGLFGLNPIEIQGRGATYFAFAEADDA